MVSSVQPLATTRICKSAVGTAGMSWPSSRPITRPSLCAGMTMVVTPREYGGKIAARLGYTDGPYGPGHKTRA